MRILNKTMLTGHGNRVGRKIVTELLDAGLDAVDPYSRVKKLVQVKDGKIILDNRDFEMRNDPHSGPAVYETWNFDRILVIGAGKGIQRAARALEDVLGDLLTGGVVIAKHGEKLLCRNVHRLSQYEQGADIDILVLFFTDAAIVTLPKRAPRARG